MSKEIIRLNPFINQVFSNALHEYPKKHGLSSLNPFINQVFSNP